MRKPLLAPDNGCGSDIKGDHLKASVRQFLSIIAKPATNNEGSLAFAPNVSAIQPSDEVGIDFHLRPVDGPLIALSLSIQSFEPARCIPPLHRLLGEMSCLCSCLLFHLASPVFSCVFRLRSSRVLQSLCRQRAGPGRDKVWCHDDTSARSCRVAQSLCQRADLDLLCCD